MCAPIELETGKIKYPAYDKSRNTYYEHPRTGVRIPGFEIPFWEETAELCLRAAKLVEGNNLPGYDFLQMPPHVPNRVGMLPRFREFVEGI